MDIQKEPGEKIVMEKKIQKIETYINEKQFEVREAIDIATQEKSYLGAATILIKTGNPVRPVVPQQMSFIFPKEIDTVEKAFDSFEKYLNEEVELFFKEIEKQQMAQSKQIIPATSVPQIPQGPNTIQFNPNHKGKKR